MIKRKDGMLVAFIDFSKAYDKVDREKLWSCLQSVGVEGRLLRFYRLCMFFGVGTLHPKTSLWFEMQMCPVLAEGVER